MRTLGRAATAALLALLTLGARALVVPPAVASRGRRPRPVGGRTGAAATQSALVHGRDARRGGAPPSALRLAYYDGPPGGGWEGGGGPPFDGRGMRPPPGYGRGMRPGLQQDPYYPGPSANQENPGYYRNNRGGGRGNGGGFVGPRGGPSVRPNGMGAQTMGGRGAQGGGMGAQTMGGRGPQGRGMGAQTMGGQYGMGGMGGMGSRTMGGQYGMGGMGGMMGGPPPGLDPFVNPESLRDSRAWGPGQQQPPAAFGRDAAVARMSLKDRAAGTTQSFDAEVIRSMNNRGRAGEPGDERPVPLSSIYGQRSPPTPATDRSPPLDGGPAPPAPAFVDASVPATGALPPTVRAARSVRPSVVLVTSKGVRKENSQGSGFVVAFDDSDTDDDDEATDRVYILTSAHVAPPGWKVSVTFPGDPDDQLPATVVGRKLNSDLALLCVAAAAVDDRPPFPPPLVLTGEEVSTEAFPDAGARGRRAPAAEIGSPVYSFGYPMGVEGPTMTSGILCATTKGINYMDAPTGEEPAEISKSRPFERTAFVITDATMAGGMSGGPLVNPEGIVLGINALVRPDLRALGNYAVSALECETFLERLEDKRAGGAAKRTGRRQAPREDDAPSSSRQEGSGTEDGDGAVEPQTSAAVEEDSGVAGYRVMLYGYSTDKADAMKTLRKVAGLDELRAENAMRSTNSFGAGVVDEFYIAETGGRARAVKAARRSADELQDKLKEEGMMVEVEPLNLLS